MSSAMRSGGRHVLRTALVGLLVILACDQPSDSLFGPDVPQFASGSSGLFGTVTEPDGTPIPDADVNVKDQATGSTIATATTDSYGDYTISVADGTYDVEVSKSGFGARTIKDVTVSGATSLNVVLVQLIGVAGILETDDGTKLGGQYIYFYGSSGNYSTQTGSDGTYSVTLPAGTYNIQIRGGTNHSTIPYSYYLYASGFDFSSTTVQDFVLTTHSVTVTVTEQSSGDVVQNARPRVCSSYARMTVASGHTASGSYCSQVQTDASGVASVPVFPTYYDHPSIDELIVYPPSGVALGQASVSLAPISSDLSLSVALPPPTSISGTVYLNGSAKSSIQVRAYRSGASFYDYTDASGAYEVEVSPETYTVQLYGSGSGWPYAAYVNAGSFDITSNLTQDFSLGTHTLTVTVNDPAGNPVENVQLTGCTYSVRTVVYGSTEGTGRQCANSTTNSSGQVAMPVFSTSSGWTITARPPSGSGFGATAFTVGAISGDVSTTVTLEETIKYSGTVSGDGTNLAGVRVMLSYGSVSNYVNTDSNGDFELSTPPGSYYLSLFRSNYSQTDVPVYFSMTGYHKTSTGYLTTRSIDTDLSETLDLTVHRINAQVLDPAGNPVPNVRFQATAYATMDVGGWHIRNGYFQMRAVSDATGKADIATFPTSGSFSLTAYPPSGSDLVTTSVQVEQITEDINLVIIMQPKNDPPVIDFDPASATIDEGGSVSVTATATDPEGETVTTSWVLPSGCTENGLTVDCTFDDDGTYDLRLTADDGDGGLSTAAATITVNNVAPQDVTISGDASTNVGDSYTVTGSFTDPGADTWTYTVDWGDGTTSTGSADLVSGMSDSHEYGDGGDYTVTLTIADDDGGAGSASLDVEVVSNRPPVADAGGPYTVAEGSSVELDGSGSYDPDAGDVLTYSWSADGGTLVGSTFSADDGPAGYTATLTVTDPAGASSTATADIEVTNVAPTVDAGDDAGILSGESFELSAWFDDPGADSWDYSVDWSNGPLSTATLSTTGAFSVPGPTYLASGDYVVTVEVTDDDGGSGSDQITLTVSRAPMIIDVMPGSAENPFKLNTRQRGTLPVAVLGSADFDVSQLDPATILAGNATSTGVPVESRNGRRLMASYEDVNLDGYTDLMLHFDRVSLIGTYITSTSTELVLTGESYGGVEFIGSDVIRPIP